PTTDPATLSLHDALPIFRNAGDREAARAQPHVGGVRLEQMRGEPPRLRDDGVGRVSQRAAAERGAAAAEGPDSRRNDVGIAVTEDRKSTRLNSSHRTISY